MNLKTIIFIFFSFVLLATLATGQTNPYNKLDKLKVNDLIAQKLEVQSTTKGAIPCPSMTQTQRNAIPTPLEASCVFNQDSNSLNVYDGSGWVEVGAGGAGGGGINNWETAYFYDIGDVVIESNKIYQCNTAHTSSVFATDIAKWTKLVAPISLTTEVSGVLPMANGGSEKALTPVLGGVVYTDGGSMEVLGAGTSGQLLKSNGAAAPEWTTLSVDDATFSGVLSLGKGGTNKNLTASNGAIAYSDADSIELLAPGTSGQVLQSNGVAAPSYVNKSISAKAENASSVTLEEIQVSNNQLTQTDSNKQKIETGNKNILVNPSFEHSTFSTGWTSGAGSFSQNLTVEIDGLKAAEVTLSAQALAITQDSTLYAAQFADGVQGLASVRVKTSLSGIKVCSRQAGVTSTTNCVNVQGNGKWGLYKVPMILGATSNGIIIASNGTSLTGTVYLDDAFVGATDLTQNMNACNSPSCETEFSAAISGAGVITQESSDWLGTCVRSGTGNRTATCTVNPSLGLTTGMNCTGNINQAITTAFSAGVVNVVSTSSTNIVFDTAQASDGAGVGISSYIVCQKQGADFTAAKQLSNGNTYSSTAINNIDRIGEIIFTTKSTAPNGFISALNSSIGQSGSGASFSGDTYYTLYEHLWNVPGLSTTAGDPYRISSAKGASALVDWQANKTITVDYATNEVFVRAKGNARNAGSYQDSDNKAHTHNITTRISSGVAGANVISSSNTASTYTDTISINSSGGTESRPKNVALFAYIRFSGDTILAVAQLSGLESCTNTLECTDTFTARISSAGVTSRENYDWVSGNASIPSTGTFNLTLNSGIFSVLPNCVVTAEAAVGNPGVGYITVNSTTSVSVFLRNTSNALGNYDFYITCQKQGADYVGKTAKAVASDQNIRSIGAVGVDMQSVYFAGAVASTVCSTSPCTIYNSIGSKITSVTRVQTGGYQLNGIDGLKYNCTGNGFNSSRRTGLHDRLASTTSYAYISFDNIDTAYNSIICIGIP
jgi:hypothetical protein